MTVEQKIWEAVHAYSEKFNHPPSVILMHPTAYGLLVKSLRARLIYLPTEPDSSLRYNGLGILRTEDLDKKEVRIL